MTRTAKIAASSVIDGAENSETNGHSNGTGARRRTTNGSSQHLLESPKALTMPIAICGMGMRLPGGIRNDSDLFQFLVGKQDARTKVPDTRYNIDAYYNAHSKPGSIASRHGYFLEDVDITKCDASMFSMTAAELSRVDPSQRLLLEVVREAFESAGEANFRGKNIGTYASVYSEDWQDLQNRDLNDYAPYQLTGKMDFMLGNRIAYEYDLNGPSMTLKAACSSSGLALHQALQSIRLGETSSAIVAAANLLIAPGLGVTMTATSALSPNGSSKTFDASADGYARAEGVSCIYVKRLDEALRDGNPIRAVIRASASNADGRTAGLTLPSPVAQEALIRQAYKNAGVGFDSTAMFECHGTGTAAGDPLEVSAIAKCFGERGIYIGSVKPNLGHSEGASALTSILKAVVSLENQTIIPNVKFVTPNPAIPWKSAKLKVPTEPMVWPAGRSERISVNSFGFGGSNVHFILDSAKSFGIPSPWELQAFSLPATAAKTLLLFSANSEESLKTVANDHYTYLQKFPGQIESMAYTLAEHRERLNLRGFSVTDGSTPFQLVGPIKNQSSGGSRLAFVFTGQGAQWIRMGKGLIREHPVFSDSIRKMDAVLQSLEHAPTWTIENILSTCDDSAILGKAEISQPICTALQVALVDLLATWDVTPSVVIGHSSGEIAAAYAAGALSLKEAAIVSFYRGFVCNKSQKQGAMSAVGLGREDVQPFIVPGVRIACENSGKSVTLSGDIKPLEETMAAIKNNHPETLVRKLHVERAYHSHHMREIGDAYHDLISKHLEPQTPRLPFLSSVKVKLLSKPDDFGPKYWQENLEKPVLFHSAARRLLYDFPDISNHVEVGPHSALAGPLRQIYAEKPVSTRYYSCLTRGKDDAASFLETMGQLYCIGINIRLPVSPDAQVLAQLPTYPWHYTDSYWAETRLMSDWRFRQHAAHDLLGSRVLETSDLEPTWRNILRAVDVPWLRDHCVGSDVVFPGAAYLAMAGEAVSQLRSSNDGVQAGYTVRDVHFTSAMLLRDDNTTELITALRPRMLTSTEDSTWYEFTIMSHDGNTWTRHCRGLVTNSCTTHLKPKFVSQTFNRKVSSHRWYKAMARSGLNYGPRFIGLQDITASVSDTVASAKVVNRQHDSESRYAIHPTTIDVIFQSWTVATKNGVPRNLTRLALPTFIEELSIRPVASSETIEFITSGDDFQASSHGSVNGTTVFYLQGFKGTPLGNNLADKSGDFTVQHLQWKPDIDFTDAKTLMRPNMHAKPEVELVERLLVLCAVEARQELTGATPSQPHFAKFLSWLDKLVERFREPRYPLVEDSAALVDLSSETRIMMIHECLEKAQTMESQPFATAIWRSYSHIKDIIEGRTEYLNLLLQDNILQQLYDWTNDLMDFSSYFSLLGNTQPQLRILEIGAGTGGLTSKVLQSLQSDYGERLFLSYTFTDISSGFFGQAQDRFKDYDSIVYKVLDIAQDPVEQGFELGEFDLILASNVLHATPFLNETLSHCRKLLKPNGRLFLQELATVTKSMNFVMGLFSGWWLGDNDGRVEEPYLFPEEWDVRLRQAGFAGVESVSLDGEEPYQVNSYLIARPAIDATYPQRLTVLTNPDGPGPLAQATQSLLESQGYEIDNWTWTADLPPPDQDLISFIDIEGSTQPLLKDFGADDLARFLALIDNLSQSAILWLTKPAQINCQDPYNAQILGMARTIRSELAIDIATMELEHSGAAAASAIVAVMRKLQLSRENAAMDDFEPDMEYAWVDGAIHLSRVHWLPVEQALANTSPQPESKRLVVGQRGALESLQWRGQSLEPLGTDDVEVQIKTIGMNFRELVLALGVITESAEEPDGSINAFGGEATGIVTKVGNNVEDIQVGDNVMTFGSTSPGFATQVQKHSANCIKIPSGLTDEEAATIPIAYFTVLYCLMDKAKIQKGQSLLIHSAAGGVGIAAIHIARWLGAEIYATTSSETKIEFLVNELGIARERIFSSRDSSFVEGIMQATNNAGVDVVLNSLAGELLHASWRCVAPNGIMVEIGKRDILGYGQLSMAHFQDNRTFTCVDASKLILHPPTVRRLMKQIVELYDEGCVHPIRPITTFNACDVQEAYRYMQRGQHVGKIVIKFPEHDDLPIAQSVPAPSFRGDVSYLLVGGTGGLGQAIASWMVSHGARSLIFLSPSAGKSVEHQDFFKELREAGCAVQCHAGDVADPDFVRTAINEAHLPVAGVMQMAMVLRDIGVMDMDADTWAAAVRPKIDGTWNLHNLLPKNLDFFVLFSSIAGLFGYFGQANYASANTFLDAFVQYRQGLGLVASVLDIGPIDDVGFVARTPGSLSNIVAHANLVTELDFLNALQLAVAPASAGKRNSPGSYYNPSQFAMVPGCKVSITDPENRSIWKRDPRMAIYRNLEKAATANGGGETSDILRAFLSSLATDRSKLYQEESSKMLARAIGLRVSTFLMKDVDEPDLSQDLAAAGVDSLVAIELRNWWKQSFGVDVSVLELLKGGSIQQLGNLAIEHLKEKYSTKT